MKVTGRNRDRGLRKWIQDLSYRKLTKTACNLSEHHRTHVNSDKNKTASFNTAVDLRGIAVDLRGIAVDLRGIAVDLRGNAVDLRGIAVDLRGIAVDLRGIAVDWISVLALWRPPGTIFEPRPRSASKRPLGGILELFLSLEPEMFKTASWRPPGAIF